MKRMKEKWFIAKKKADFNQIGKEFHIDPVVARVIRNRDIVGNDQIREYLEGDLSKVSSPWDMLGVKEACEILKDMIVNGKRIRIISDYDVDGISSNYILWKGISSVGGMVDYTIPDRMKDGYGINENLVNCAKKDGIDCIVTCDNGIAAASVVAYAKELGLTVIVTDHHEVPFVEEGEDRIEVLPPADVVIDTKQEACHYPYEHLCGAGVSYQLMKALYEMMKGSQEVLDELLVFVGIATVCDVVELTKENRIFVKEALKTIKQIKNIGLRALLLEYDLLEQEIASYHFGFVIGPCMNASGRLESAGMVMDLFLERDLERAKEKAHTLRDLNEKRKEMTEDGVRRALELVEQDGYDKDSILVLYLPDCHESIAGIIAGRVKDTYHKPTFVITDAREGLKGSGRSIEGFHMFEEMTRIKDVFTKFGGHAMAAGCSLLTDRLDEFRSRINANSELTEEDFVKKVTIDVDMPVDYITFDLIHQLTLLEPFGMGNKKPIFAQRQLLMEQIRVFGENRNVIRIDFKNESGQKVQGILFESEEVFFEKKGTHQYMTCTYYPTINEYRGYQNMQINIQNYFFL